MELVISEMAKLDVPEEMLDRVDIKGLIDSFKEDYDQLDDIARTRREHEDKNALMQWWDNDELEDAQLDAVELQASFSKKIGQLMVVAISQSQLLTQQQSDLIEQQATIKEQTKALSEADGKILEQQDEISKQQSALENLVNKYFEIKGLTMEGAARLVEIANDVKRTKENLESSVSEKIRSISQELSMVDVKIAKGDQKQQIKVAKEVESAHGEMIAKVKSLLTDGYNKTADEMAMLETKLDSKLEDMASVKIAKLQKLIVASGAVSIVSVSGFAALAYKLWF